MQYRHSKFVATVALILASTFAPALAAEQNGTCERLFSAKGFPNKNEAVAQLSAVRLWSETVKEMHGPEFSVWHKAGRQALRCKPDKEPGYIYCTAKGQPCKYVSADKSTK